MTALRYMFACFTALVAIASWVSPLPAAERRFVWDRVDVAVQLREDGALAVSELDRVAFTGGPFHEGFREIPLARIERIDSVQVAEIAGGGMRRYRSVLPAGFSRSVPSTYSVESIGTTIRIRWSFPATTSQARTFYITYVAHGALRVYDEPTPYQQIGWTAVDSELTKDAPVNAATLTYNLPRPVDPAMTYVEGPGGSLPRDHTQDGQSWTWSARDLGPGESLGAILQFPPLVAAKKPAWQDASDRNELLGQDRVTRNALLNLSILAVGLLVIVGGSLAVLVAWWMRGRDPEVGPIASYLAAPPGDLPPVVVGALVDESVDQRDIVATIVDLARRGVVQLVDSGPMRLSALVMAQQKPELSPFEDALLRALFGEKFGTASPVALLDMQERFAAEGKALRESLYAELVRRGFFRESPSRTRASWYIAGFVVLVVAVIATWAGVASISAIAPMALVVGATLLVPALLVLMVARFMPQKTRSGAEAAARWRAFRTYLASIERFERLDAARDLFDRYLPYAIVFGLERSWVEAFSRVPTPAPVWYRGSGWSLDLPRGFGLGPSHTSGGGGGATSPAIPISGGGGRSPTPSSLQAVSGQAQQSLQAMSSALSSWFNTAGAAFSPGQLSDITGNPVVRTAGRVGFRGALTGAKIAVAIFRGMSGGGRGGFS